MACVMVLASVFSAILAPTVTGESYIVRNWYNKAGCQMADKISSQFYERGTCLYIDSETNPGWFTANCDDFGMVYRSFFSDNKCQEPKTSTIAYSEACTDSRNFYGRDAINNMGRQCPAGQEWAEFKCAKGPITKYQHYLKAGCADVDVDLRYSGIEAYDENCQNIFFSSQCNGTWKVTGSVRVTVADGKFSQLGYASGNCRGVANPASSSDVYPQSYSMTCNGECKNYAGAFMTFMAPGCAPTTTTMTTTTTTTTMMVKTRVASSAQPSAANFRLGAAASLLAACAAPFGA